MKLFGGAFPDRKAIPKRSGAAPRIVRRVDWPAAFSIPEAAKACGVSERTLRGRIERGTLTAHRKNGRVVIPTVDLLSAGLLPGEADRAEPGKVSRGQLPGQESGAPDLVALLGETIRALQEAEAERGRLRGLLESAETKERAEQAARDAAQAEVLELRARVKELEAQADAPAPAEDAPQAEAAPRSWWQRMLGGDDARAA